MNSYVYITLIIKQMDNLYKKKHAEIKYKSQITVMFELFF